MLATRQQSLDFFSGVESRYESLGMINGCEIINDSRATDIESTLYSLEMTSTPVHLILGNVDVAQLMESVSKQIRMKVVTLGVYGDFDYSLNAEIVSIVDKTVYGQKLDDVVIKMVNWLKPGETLLFSPASPGMEMHEDFSQRAMHFQKIVEPYLNQK